MQSRRVGVGSQQLLQAGQVLSDAESLAGHPGQQPSNSFTCMRQHVLASFPSCASHCLGQTAHKLRPKDRVHRGGMLTSQFRPLHTAASRGLQDAPASRQPGRPGANAQHPAECSRCSAELHLRSVLLSGSTPASRQRFLRLVLLGCGLLPAGCAPHARLGDVGPVRRCRDFLSAGGGPGTRPGAV